MGKNITLDTIRNKIYVLRGLQVILDRDLAELQGVSTSRVNEQVKRNINRFPSDFIIKLSENEVDFMVSHNAIPSKQVLGGHLPYAFTEQGIAMLSSVLRSKKAVEVNINIMRAFVAMRKFIIQNQDFLFKLNIIESKVLEHDNKINKVFDLLNKNSLPKKGIFFEGQIFDAYKFVNDLIQSAKKSIILIDNYIDYSTLSLFINSKEVIIYTYLMDKVNQDIEKYKSQYKNLVVKNFNKSHDRFLIIDNNVFHIGASLKDLGKKWFAFSKMNDFKDVILKRLDG